MITTILYIVGSILIVASIFLDYNLPSALLMAGFLILVYAMLRTLWLSLN